MAIYEVQAPDGSVFEIEGPDDATDDQIAAFAQSQFSGGQQPQRADPTAGLENYNPTQEMSGGQLLAAGIGRGVVNAGRGVYQGAQQIPRPGDLTSAFSGGPDRLGAVRDQIQEDRRIDAPLLATGPGMVGNVLGTAAVLAPTALVPGANTYAGASAIGAGSGFALTPGSFDERVQAGKFGAVGGLVGKGAGDLLARGGRATVDALGRRGAARSAERSVSDATAAEARAAGYVIPPTQTNPTGLNKFLEGIAGKLTTAQKASAKNMEVVNRDARKVLGIGGKGQIAESDIERAMAPHLAPYQQAAAANPNAKFALEQWRTKNEELRDLWRDYAKNSRVETKRAIEQARADADGWLTAIEAEAGTPGLSAQLKAARVQLGRIGSVEDFLNEGSGNVSIQKIASAMRAGKMVPEELKTAGRLGQAHKEATKEITSSLPGWSPLDAVVAGAALGGDVYGGGGMNPYLLSVALARPAIRNALLTKTFQGGAKYGPNALLRGGVNAVENRVTQNALSRVGAGYGSQQQPR